MLPLISHICFQISWISWTKWLKEFINYVHHYVHHTLMFNTILRNKIKCNCSLNFSCIRILSINHYIPQVRFNWWRYFSSDKFLFFFFTITFIFNIINFPEITYSSSFIIIFYCCSKNVLVSLINLYLINLSMFLFFFH